MLMPLCYLTASPRMRHATPILRAQLPERETEPAVTLQDRLEMEHNIQDLHFEISTLVNTLTSIHSSVLG